MIQIDAWLSYNELNKGHSANTVHHYRKVVERFSAWLRSQGRSVQAAQPQDLQEFAGAVLHAEKLSPSSRRVAVSALRSYYRFLQRRKVLQDNPAADLPYPKMGRKLPVPIPLAAAEKLMAEPDLDTFKGVRDVAMMSVLLGCGPRVAGVCGLNECDLLFAPNEAGVEELTIRFREKGGKERVVPAPEDTRLLVRAYLGHPELERIDRRLPNGELVLFVNIYNSKVSPPEHRGEARRLSTWSAWDMLRGYATQAGVDPKLVHPHAFRHLYGQELAEHDVDLVVRQRLLGHAKPESTEVYSHIAYRKLRQEMKRANPLASIRTPATGLAGLLKGR